LVPSIIIDIEIGSRLFEHWNFHAQAQFNSQMIPERRKICKKWSVGKQSLFNTYKEDSSWPCIHTSLQVENRWVERWGLPHRFY